MYDLHSHTSCRASTMAPPKSRTPSKSPALPRRTAPARFLATPHRKDVTELSSVGHIREVTARLQRRIRAEDIPLTLMIGMENHIDATLPGDAAAGKALTMNGSRYILVEMPFFGAIEEHDYVEDALLGLQAQGLVPVFAHPERIEAFQLKPALLEHYIGMGMLSQLTRGSLLGHWGEEVRRFSLELLSNGMVHLLSSDTHSPHPPRTPELGEALRIASEIVGCQRASAMVNDIPLAILKDEAPSSLSCNILLAPATRQSIR